MIKKLLKILTFGILGMIVAITLVLGYFGFVPGVSVLFGSNKPRDLGINFTVQDSEAARQKMGVTFEELPATAVPEETLKFSGQKVIQQSFSDTELSALIAHDPWKYNYVANPQLKIHGDGTIECSGLFIKDRFPGYLQAHRVSDQTSKAIVDNMGFLPSRTPVYCQLTASWTENKLTVDVREVQVARLGIPDDQINKFESQLEADLQRTVLSVPGLTIKSLTFTNGQMTYDGTFPEKISWATK